MWDIKYLVYEFLHRKSFQDFLNNRFRDENRVILDSEYVSHIVLKNGDLFYVSKDIGSLTSVYEEYQFDDIRKEDIVIDIGANIGGFCIPVSRISSHVYAVEPVTVSELEKIYPSTKGMYIS